MNSDGIDDQGREHPNQSIRHDAGRDETRVYGLPKGPPAWPRIAPAARRITRNRRREKVFGYARARTARAWTE
jgi:hypothetical protein